MSQPSTSHESLNRSPSQLITQLLTRMIQRGGSDLFLTVGYPPRIKVNGKLEACASTRLTSEMASKLILAMMRDHQRLEYEKTHECNFAISPGEDLGRFRVNAFYQQGDAGAVLRTIPVKIPTVEEIGIPEHLKDIVMAKRGLVIMVGATGSGKSTTLAALVGHRNRNTQGHILTVEDPIEFVHHQYDEGCIVNQREVGIDTDSWENALTNSLRQAPDVIQIGEIRTRETMEFAVQFSETGHLCLSTLHANNANQALDRIINLFPDEKRNQVLLDLSFNLKAVVSQRLVRTADGKGRVPAVEILINTPYIQDLIQKGKVGEIKEAMQKGGQEGMQTFDDSLLGHYKAGRITREAAIANADSANELRLRIKQYHQASGDPALSDENLDGLALEEEEESSAGAGLHLA